MGNASLKITDNSTGHATLFVTWGHQCSDKDNNSGIYII
jgi:hypothetical protein